MMRLPPPFVAVGWVILSLLFLRGGGGEEPNGLYGGIVRLFRSESLPTDTLSVLGGYAWFPFLDLFPVTIHPLWWEWDPHSCDDLSLPPSLRYRAANLSFIFSLSLFRVVIMKREIVGIGCGSRSMVKKGNNLSSKWDVIECAN